MENEPLEPRSRSPKFNRRMNIQGEAQESAQPKKRSLVGSSIGVTALIMSLAVAIAGDIAGLAFEIIPGIGGVFVSLIVTPIGFASIWGINSIAGKKMGSRSRKSMLACLAIEMVPIVNALPALTAWVVISKMSEAAENASPSTDSI